MRVLLVDDHALFRLGLRELLVRRGIEVVDAVGDGERGLRLALEHRPDVVLLDMRMPDTDGLAVLRGIIAAEAAINVAMLTTSADEGDVIESLKLGARGYLLKDMEPAALIGALERIVRDEIAVAPELTGVLAKAVQGRLQPEKKVAAAPADDLTPREMEILCHVAEGKSNKAIANELGITEGTVKLHVKAVLRKLAIRSRVEAAVIAVEQGLCDRT